MFSFLVRTATRPGQTTRLTGHGHTTTLSKPGHTTRLNIRATSPGTMHMPFSSFRSAHKLTLIVAMFLSLASAASSMHDDKYVYKGSATVPNVEVAEDGTKIYFGPTPPTKEERTNSNRTQDEIREKATALRRDVEQECVRAGGWFCNRTNLCRANKEVGIFNLNGHVCKTCQYNTNSKWWDERSRKKNTKAEQQLLEKAIASAQKRAAADNLANSTKVDGQGCLPGGKSFGLNRRRRLGWKPSDALSVRRIPLPKSPTARKRANSLCLPRPSGNGRR